MLRFDEYRFVELQEEVSCVMTLVCGMTHFPEHQITRTEVVKIAFPIIIQEPLQVNYILADRYHDPADGISRIAFHHVGESTGCVVNHHRSERFILVSLEIQTLVVNENTIVIQ